VQPIYSAAVARVADLALSLIEAGQRVTRLRAEGVAIHFFTDLVEGPAPITSYNAHLLHFYVVLFASIFVVYPGLGLRRRLTLMALSLAGLFLFQVAVVLIDVEHLYAIELPPQGARAYGDAERAFWEWVHRTASFFAVQFIPAAALAILFVTQGGLFERRAAPARPALPGKAGRRMRVATVAAVLLTAAVILTPFVRVHMGRIDERQAEKECLQGYRALGASAWTEAAGLFTSALERSPGFAHAHEGLGLALMTRDRPTTADLEGALAEFQKADELEPTRQGSWYNAAIALGKLGRRAEEESALLKFLELKPDHREALLLMSALLIHAGRTCDALVYLERLQKVGPPPERESLVRRSIAEFEVQCGRTTRPRP
jgi:tetratricopeptide (TPR) repeat protein